MKKYLAVFVAPLAAYDKMKEEMHTQSPEKKEEHMKEWQEWMKRHPDVLVDPGAPVGAAKRVTEEGVSDTRNEIGGYMIIQAESADAAAAVFADSPHFGVADGAIEVMEMMEM